MYWARHYLAKDSLFVEAHDDVTINPFTMQAHIKEFRQSTANRVWPEFPIVCMMKKIMYDTPQRLSGRKNFLSMDKFEWPFWPDYCATSLFACNTQIAGDLWQASRTGPVYDATDAYVTGILRQRIGLPRQMLLEAKPFPASQISGFFQLRPSEVVTAMEKEWGKIKSGPPDVVFCTCQRPVA